MGHFNSGLKDDDDGIFNAGQSNPVPLHGHGYAIVDSGASDNVVSRAKQLYLSLYFWVLLAVEL